MLRHVYFISYHVKYTKDGKNYSGCGNNIVRTNKKIKTYDHIVGMSSQIEELNDYPKGSLVIISVQKMKTEIGFQSLV